MWRVRYSGEPFIHFAQIFPLSAWPTCLSQKCSRPRGAVRQSATSEENVGLKA